MLMASVQQPPEDAWEGGFLSLTFSFISFFLFLPKNSSAFYFTTTIARTGSFKCFKKQLEKSLTSPLVFPACPFIVSLMPVNKEEGRCQAPVAACSRAS